MLRNLLNDEAGFLVSAELVLVFTLVFCAVAVGVSVVKDSLAKELGDVASAIGALDQSYNTTGLEALLNGEAAGGAAHGSCNGSGFNDLQDDCDCEGIDITATTGKNDPSTLTTAEDGT